MNLPTINNKALLTEAFTHRSYLNESKERVPSNERLEFLGDSILSFVVSQYLFKKYPQYNEGMLTNLRSLMVNTKSLARIAQELELGTHLRLSKGEEESKGRQNQSLLADSFESFIGALFIDQGIDAVWQFLDDTLLHKADALVQKKTLKDPKSLLQEYVQAQKQNSPVYKVLQEEGPAHSKTFTVGVFIQDHIVGEGKGRSKQEAEENAAIKALKQYNKET